MPDPSAETYKLIPAMFFVHTASGTVRLITTRGGVAVVPSTPPASIDKSYVDPEVEREFNALAQEWLLEASYLSNPVKQFLHPLHFKIVAMGEKILPLVLKEVQKMSGHWFVILNAISPENPVKPEDETSLEKVASAWLAWGKMKGLI